MSRDSVSGNPLEGRLREAVRRVRSSPIPDASLSRALDRAAAIAANAKVDEAAPGPDSTRPRAVDIRAIGWFAAIAASILAVVLLFFASASPREGLAEVVRAFAEKDWVHVKSRDVERGEVPREAEIWFSTRNRIHFRRDAEWIEMHDHQSEVSLSYNRRENRLVRVPYGEIATPFYSSVFDVMRALFEVNEDVENPLALVAELDDDLAGIEFVAGGRTTVEEEGRTLTEFRIEARHPRVSGPLSIVVRADATSLLPESVDLSGSLDGSAFRSSAFFSYPDPGPSDVYSVGVPRGTPVAERRPEVDVSAVAEGMRRARREFDDHLTISVSRLVTPGSANAWWLGHPVIFYRKGDLFRVDFVRLSASGTPRLERPPNDADPESWWRERVRALSFAPKVILSDDKAYWLRDVDPRSPEPKVRVEHVDEKYPFSFRSEFFLPPYCGWAPEFIARPSLGIPDRTRALFLRPSPLEVAPRALQMRLEPRPRLREARSEGREKHRSLAVGDFWVDPTRGFAVVKSDWLVVEEFAETPAGGWYPRVVREPRTARSRSGSPREETDFDSLRTFYVDFDTKLPDELFDPNAPLVGAEAFSTN